ncbi:MarR family winged helix-turn-helix transcriptional regulator [Solimonas terrae]|uniref:MarR family transcriptional regulator n=1 Tax=Solimonas terrae TaxID=1396819 RepID=A0A6M2BSM4_9GAMM|nr:MarR family winged helix-turn-helix transcriptional regulator [Solimonas terrae]NGY04997.1 MarR family transcriptional regulator [Solimonas terrae]
MHSTKPGTPNKPTNDLIVEVFRLNGSLLATADRLVSKFGITAARWQVLGAIGLPEEPETVARLARNMGLSRQSVQRVVNEMVDEGMLRLLENPHHARARLVTMTDKGRNIFAAAIELQEPWVKSLSAGIGKDRINDACRILRTLRERLEAKS